MTFFSLRGHLKVLNAWLKNSLAVSSYLNLLFVKEYV